MIHVCSRVPAWITYPIAENLKIPFVTSVHGRLRNQNFLKNYYNSILIKGDVIIAISKHIKDNIVNVFPNVQDKVSIVYRGVDLENFNLNNISNTRIVNQAKLLGVRDGSPVILMASRPKAWKGHLIFIQALSKVKIDYQCFLIGALDGDEKFKSDIYKKISELNLGDKVKLTKSTNDIQSAFVLSDIVVMPSIDPEPFGRIIIEAQALKKIAIGFNHGGISESIIDNKTGLLAKPLDVDDLGKKIEIALQLNKTQRNIINKNAIKILKELFEKGIDAKYFLNDILEILSLINRKISLGSIENDKILPEEEINLINEISEGINISDIGLFWQLTIKTIEDLKIINDEEVTLEMYVMQLLHLKAVKNP